eukprot:366484-Chlamydomonas_euryale.AAC.2
MGEREVARRPSGDYDNMSSVVALDTPAAAQGPPPFVTSSTLQASVEKGLTDYCFSIYPRVSYLFSPALPHKTPPSPHQP